MAGKHASRQPNKRARLRLRNRIPIAVAFILGGLSVVGVVLLTNDPQYQTPIEIVGGFLGALITGVLGGAATRLFAKDGTSEKRGTAGKAGATGEDEGDSGNGDGGAGGQDDAAGISTTLVGQGALSGVAGAGVATLGFVLASVLTAEPVILQPIHAAPYINPVRQSNLVVTPTRAATFSVDVPAGYGELNVDFQIANSRGYDDNCLNGMHLLVDPEYGATTPAGHRATPDQSLPLAIPAGVRSLMLSVQLLPPFGYTHCDEEITVGPASTFSR